MAITQY